MRERVLFFFDYQNVHLTGLDRFENHGILPHRRVPHPLRISEIIAKRRNRESEVAAVRVHRGRPNPDHEPKLASANDSQKSHWERDKRVKVHTRPLKYPRDWPGERPREKGVDVALAVDMVRLAVTNQYDAMVLFSADSDLLPVLEMFRETRMCHIEVASWSGMQRLKFSETKLPYCHFLNQKDWEEVTEDWENPPMPPKQASLVSIREMIRRR